MTKNVSMAIKTVFMIVQKENVKLAHTIMSYKPAKKNQFVRTSVTTTSLLLLELP